MKRIYSVILALILCLSILATLTSCALVHPIDQFNSKLEKNENCQISLTMYDLPYVGNLTLITKVDGNVSYVAATALTDEMYLEIVDDVEYVYSKDESGKWEKTQSDAGSNLGASDLESISELFNSSNYEEVSDQKNTYKQKKSVVFEQYENVVMTLEDGCCVLEMDTMGEGYHVKMVISKIGEIELTLPTVK